MEHRYSIVRDGNIITVTDIINDIWVRFTEDGSKIFKFSFFEEYKPYVVDPSHVSDSSWAEIQRKEISGKTNYETNGDTCKALETNELFNFISQKFPHSDIPNRYFEYDFYLD